jgi:hypothetical protein
VLGSDSACPITGSTQLFKNCSISCFWPINASSEAYLTPRLHQIRTSVILKFPHANCRHLSTFLLQWLTQGLSQCISTRSSWPDQQVQQHW